MIDIRLSDNLELMEEMQDNTVDLIYCDILYGTGRKFKDYQDLKPKREIIEKHYIPRIEEMHRILKPTGSIYLQMDTKINHWMRCIMDDVFGYENFRNEISWRYKRWTMTSKNKWQNMHDVILMYGIDNSVKEIREPILKPKKQNKNDEKGKSLRDENGKIIYHLQTDRIVDDVWDIPFLNPVSKERLGYDTQKPKALIERIIKASSNEGDLVADFYAGSFTTAEVCKDLNRNFIGCDISEKAVAIGLERTKY
jgi:site-specific DNA-methyltransferase (adenine-specific)